MHFPPHPPNPLAQPGSGRAVSIRQPELRHKPILQDFFDLCRLEAEHVNDDPESAADPQCMYSAAPGPARLVLAAVILAQAILYGLGLCLLVRG